MSPEPSPWLANPARARVWTCPAVPDDVLEFHRGLPDYAPTPLVDLPVLARELGVGRVLEEPEPVLLRVEEVLDPGVGCTAGA